MASHRNRSRSKRREQADAATDSCEEEVIGGPATPNGSCTSSSSSYYSDEYTIAGSDGEPPPKKTGGGDHKEDIVHFDWHDEMVLDSRYQIKSLCGDGTFGRVLLAYDQRRQRDVAIKVIRDVEKYRRCAKREAELLRDIRDADTRNKSRCVRLYDKFLHEGKYFCLVCEVLGASLYDVLKGNQYRGFFLEDIQSIIQQCLQALSFLHEELHMAHTDLKLENILFRCTEDPVPAVFPRDGTQRESRHRHRGHYVRPASTGIKLIDFGNATYDDDHHSRIVNTRQYRAPEVILHNGWKESSDLWSMGCIAMETYTGELLFRTHANLEHLFLMEKIVEPIPQHMFDKSGVEARDEFLEEVKGKWQLRKDEFAADEAGTAKVAKVHKLADTVLSKHRSLTDVTARMLRTDPSKRPTAGELLRDPFFSIQFTDED